MQKSANGQLAKGLGSVKMPRCSNADRRVYTSSLAPKFSPSLGRKRIVYRRGRWASQDSRKPIRLRTGAEAAPTWHKHGLRHSVAGFPLQTSEPKPDGRAIDP